MSSKYNRLDRFVSQHLTIKRKDIRLMLAQKRIMVDGTIACDAQTRIGPFNTVVVDNKVIQAQEAIYIMMHKPLGVVSATTDERHTTVLDLINPSYSCNLHIVGRLDLNTTGLLLLTNDGRWSQSLTSPDNKVSKSYIVNLKNTITNNYIEAFEQGMFFSFENITTRPALLTITGDKQAQVILQEGRYHQIKRMFGRFRNPVTALHRNAIGSLNLPTDLKPSEYRALTKLELNELNDFFLVENK